MNIQYKYSKKRYNYNTMSYIEILSFIPFVILILLPYYYHISCLILLVIVLMNKYVNICIFKIIKYIQKTILFFLYFIVNIILLDDYSFNGMNYLKQFIYLPYYLKIYFIDNYIYKIYIHYFIFIIPDYFKKIFLINIIHIITTNNLFIFMKNEAIIKNVFNKIIKKSILKHYKQQLKLFTISINYQILEKNINNFQNIYLGIRTKQNVSKDHFFIYIHNYLDNSLSIFINNKYSLMLSIWNRY
uniref:Uncharacterized protein n=1 Tax=Vertebrata australis TaxID=1967852 RepID=A0A1Z1MI80_9FLOR|nr:hypothetical protein [Vertebrata australis]ARW65778.1 hypothetical protein [Vertebrata australis]